ncbi:DUF4250 domain-containing protein [Butyrivibrio sp. MC2021]|uniref:DUF4250 domain-containing protein n=1 Tax=Butyrivibrio sp. MC2021 TaxID=1408306 RepID=UPI00047BCA3E|nr:DUF4250 domain-containing protein [Butyrivibrio sp. MC2021]
MIPKDPVMLLSFMNMKLRDNYSSLDAMFEDIDISAEEQKEIVEKLKGIGYVYDSEKNQFS